LSIEDQVSVPAFISYPEKVTLAAGRKVAR
jgi:hypothetical protein